MDSTRLTQHVAVRRADSRSAARRSRWRRSATGARATAPWGVRRSASAMCQRRAGAAAVLLAVGAGQLRRPVHALRRQRGRRRDPLASGRMIAAGRRRAGGGERQSTGRSSISPARAMRAAPTITSAARRRRAAADRAGARCTTSRWSASATNHPGVGPRHARRRRRRPTASRGRCSPTSIRPCRCNLHIQAVCEATLRSPHGHRRPRAARHRPATTSRASPQLFESGARVKSYGEWHTDGAPSVPHLWFTGIAIRAGGAASTSTSSAQMRASSARRFGRVERLNVRAQPRQQATQLRGCAPCRALTSRPLAARAAARSHRAAPQVVDAASARSRLQRRVLLHQARRRRARTPARIIIASAPPSWSVCPAVGVRRLRQPESISTACRARPAETPYGVITASRGPASRKRSCALISQYDVKASMMSWARPSANWRAPVSQMPCAFTQLNTCPPVQRDRGRRAARCAASQMRNASSGRRCRPPCRRAPTARPA